MIFVLDKGGSTLTSMVKVGAMVSVATTTAKDSMGVRMPESSMQG
jgi:hypothetical protein